MTDVDVDVDEVLMVRHAATAFSGLRYCGHSDPPLNPSGRDEAERLARVLLGIGPVDRIVTSPLRRAVQTAEPIARALDRPLEIDGRWREADLGDADGLTFDELEERWPDVAASLLAGSTEIDWPGGERSRDLVVRVAAAWADLTATGDARRTIVVTHGGPILVVASLISPGSGPLQSVLATGSIMRFARTANDTWQPVSDFAATLGS